ncbi:hypothetical protein [Streptomyces californicus]|uniref:hypothetical protein n=1 Tax=Streptomyces californicus TaxID=67351 RepID=UPI0033E6C470
MATQQHDITPAPGLAAEDTMRRAVAHLIATFENLGPEHQALRAEETQTSAKERRGTVVRMGDGIAQAARTVSLTIGVLATVHGLRDLGITYQLSKTAEGDDYSPLGQTGSSDSLYDALGYLAEAAATLGKAYAPTKKHPGLAVARNPEHMRVALSSLREALSTVCADLAKEDAEVAEGYAPAQTLLSELEDRVCRTMPAQRTGPSAEEVAAAIRADPEIARAAVEALAARTPAEALV